MKKWLVVSTLALSMSCINSSYATDPVTAAGIAAAAAEGAVVAEGAAAAAGIGSLVGGGALIGSGVGIGVAAVGAGSAKVINDKFFEECSNPEKVACDRAQTGSYVGAGLGVLGSLGALWSAGVSTAGLTSIGAALGGGAIVGSTALIAAPIVTAAAVGWGTYAWYTRGADNGGASQTKGEAANEDAGKNGSSTVVAKGTAGNPESTEEMASVTEDGENEDTAAKEAAKEAAP